MNLEEEEFVLVHDFSDFSAWWLSPIAMGFVVTQSFGAELK